MSEAVVPNQPNQPESEIHPEIAPIVLNPNPTPEVRDPSQSRQREEGWTIVNFPDAIGIEALVSETPESGLTERIEIDPADLTPEATVAEIAAIDRPTQEGSLQQLQQQNQELRTHVSQLESALAKAQTALREEMDRWHTLALVQPQSPHDQAELIQRHNQELSAAQARIQQLFQELELSHQTAQRQQILVETLTAQLQASHEQIAQLERECALTQQRYTEQVQLLHQSDNTCRDLRSRLHRQQRYTLQFKAALEKCLDVATPQTNADVWNVIDETTIVPNNNRHPAPGVKLGIPRSQPVKPWSAPSPAEEEKPDPAFQAWLNDFMKTGAAPSETEADSLPMSSPTPSPSNMPQPFWASFTEADEQEASAHEPLVREDWVGSPIAPDAASDPEPDPEGTEEANFQPRSLATDATNPAESLSIEPSPAPLLERLDSLSALDLSPSESVKVETVGAELASLETAHQGAIEQETVCETPEEILQKMSGIAPVLYPLRSAKKRESLAAVELPMFPRNGFSQA